MNVYSEKINIAKEKDLVLFLESKGCTFSEQVHACFKAKHKDFTAVLYQSGKFVLQGKDVAGVAGELANLLNLKSIQAPKTVGQEINVPVRHIGIDESGKGDYFGPLIIAGVLVDEKTAPMLKSLGIKDSKKLDDSTILKLAERIQKECPYSVVTINPERYNELYEKFRNLNKLLAWGHSRAIENILQKHDCGFALSDKFGDERLIKNALMDKGREITLEQMVRAESDIAVAAASIVARSEFVKKMESLSSYYSIPLHKGASDIVIGDAINFAKRYGIERLNEVAKIHFKTTFTVRAKLV